MGGTHYYTYTYTTNLSRKVHKELLTVGASEEETGCQGWEEIFSFSSSGLFEVFLSAFVIDVKHKNIKGKHKTKTWPCRHQTQYFLGEVKRINSKII